MDLPPPSSSLSDVAMPRKWARKAERYCCLVATYFPLAFVYSITTWAVWVEAKIGTLPTDTIWVGKGTSFLGIALWALLNWSYTTAVFTSPGTTISTNGYSSLPTQAPPAATNFTVKANGELRYCKKCQARKPDRAHHCSTCRTCVLKMDHHCPWLATCVGLRNYKAFMLFLIYTTLFCWVSFAVSGVWVYAEIFNDGQNSDSLMPINYVMLAVLSGIIGLVLAGFTGWHILLASRGQTTIECLEKTRYLSPLRRSMQDPNYGQQMRDMANGHAPQGQQYDAYERTRARQRYDEYLDEQDSEKLPSAFDLGWKRNLSHLFGPSKALWFVPICNTTGDGWSWEPSPKWLAAREAIQKERYEQRVREHAAGWGAEPSPQNSEFPAQTIQHQRQESASRQYVSYPTRSTSKADKVLGRSTSKADKILGRDTEEYADGGALPENQRTRRARDPYDIGDEEGSFTMENLRPKREAPDPYEISSDEEEADRKTLDRKAAVGWPRKVGIATNTILGNTAARQKDDVRGWDGQDEGVD